VLILGDLAVAHQAETNRLHYRLLLLFWSLQRSGKSTCFYARLQSSYYLNRF